MEVPWNYDDVWNNIQTQEIELKNENQEEICWIGMMVPDQACEANYFFCGMRILNCDQEEIASLIWDFSQCKGRQWTDLEVPSGMSPIGVDLYEES